MLIASIDLETTGLDPSWCQVLEVGLVLWDTTDFKTPVKDLPAFHCYVVHPQIRGEAFALAMNAKILERIAKREPGYAYVAPGQVGREVLYFLRAQEGVVVRNEGKGLFAELSGAGFNFDNFDRQFLSRLTNFNSTIKFSHRALSPGSLFFDPMTDVKLPSSDEVFRRSGVTVAPADRHTALGDARAVIEVLRAGYNRPGDDGSVAAGGTRCPDCGDRKVVRVPTDHGEWDDVPCRVCNPHDMFGRRIESAAHASLN